MILLKILSVLLAPAAMLSLLLYGVLSPEWFTVGCLGLAVVILTLLVMGLYRAQEEQDRQLGEATRDLFAMRRRVAVMEHDVQRLYEAEEL